MYSERDMIEINGRLRRAWAVLIPLLAVIAAAFIFALAARVRWLALVACPLFIVVFMYGFIAHIWPNLRYRRFLKDMESGLSRDVRGVIVAIADAAECQDGAMVLPVRLRLTEATQAASRGSALSERLQLETGEDTREERIVYLNASKRAMMPQPGATVTLRCFGRHIRSVEAEGA